ncbi:MAG TPA: NAD(P)/FAD-dependent oxidoreductase [Azospirillaceae bacterium]|nr:NAD(P)/FAD-dependent oxidoreductase [Azospirillaceae bacterium]
MRGLHIGVIGCGVAGMATALLLSRRGHRTTVFDQADRPRPTGPASLVQPAGLAVLDRLRLLGTLSTLGTRIERIVGYAAGRRTVFDLRYRDLVPGAAALGLHPGALFQALFEAVHEEPGIDVKPGTRIVAVDPVDEGVMLVEAGGPAFGPFHMAIVADGAGSTLRSALGFSVREREDDWAVLHGFAPDPRGLFAGVARQIHAGTSRFAAVLPAGRLPDDPGGWPLAWVAWGIPAQALSRWRGDGMARWRADAAALWPAASPLWDFFQSPDDLDVLRWRDVAMARLGHGPVALVGDAVRGGSPLLHQATTQALVDAALLADAVEAARTVEDATAAYDAVRRPAVALGRTAARCAAPFLLSKFTPLGGVRDAFAGPLLRLPGPGRRIAAALAGLGGAPPDVQAQTSGLNN